MELKIHYADGTLSIHPPRGGLQAALDTLDKEKLRLPADGSANVVIITDDREDIIEVQRCMRAAGGSSTSPVGDALVNGTPEEAYQAMHDTYGLLPAAEERA